MSVASDWLNTKKSTSQDCGFLSWLSYESSHHGNMESFTYWYWCDLL